MDVLDRSNCCLAPFIITFTNIEDGCVVYRGLEFEEYNVYDSHCEVWSILCLICSLAGLIRDSAVNIIWR